MRALLITASLALSACATTGAPETPGQRLYAAYAAYEVAASAAADYADTPTPSPKIVAALKKAKDEARPAVDFGKAYIACKGFNATLTPLADCTFWDFRPSSLAQWAITLRAAVAALAVRGN